MPYCTVETVKETVDSRGRGLVCPLKKKRVGISIPHILNKGKINTGVPGEGLCMPHTLWESLKKKKEMGLGEAHGNGFMYSIP